MPRPTKEGLYRKADSPYWYYRFYLPDGKLTRASTGETDYERAEKVYKTKRQAANCKPTNSGAPTVVEILDLYHYEKGRHSKRNGYTYARQQLLDWFAGAEWEQLGRKGDPHRIAKYIKHRQAAGVSPGTINIEIGMLSAAANIAIDEGHEIRNHARGKRLPEPQPNYVWLTPEQGVALLKACRYTLQNKYAAPSIHLFDFVVIGLGTGMRTSEILTLHTRQIDTAAAVIRLPETKSGNPHEIPMTPEVAEAVRRCINRSTSPWLFYNPKTGKPLTTITQQFKSACKRAGIPITNRKEGIVGFKCYGMRHTFASWLLEGGASLEEIGDLLNHRDPRTTKRYAKHTKDGRKRTLSRLPKL